MTKNISTELGLGQDMKRGYLERERKILLFPVLGHRELPPVFWSQETSLFQFHYIGYIGLCRESGSSEEHLLWLSLLPTSFPSPGKALVNVEMFNKWIHLYALCLSSPRACLYWNVTFTACGGRGDILHGLIIKKKRKPVLTKSLYPGLYWYC